MVCGRLSPVPVVNGSCSGEEPFQVREAGVFNASSYSSQPRTVWRAKRRSGRGVAVILGHEVLMADVSPSLSSEPLVFTFDPAAAGAAGTLPETV
jgi:hypothetical protein